MTPRLQIVVRKLAAMTETPATPISGEISPGDTMRHPARPAFRAVLHFERGWAARQNVHVATLDEAAVLLADGEA